MQFSSQRSQRPLNLSRFGTVLTAPILVFCAMFFSANSAQAQLKDGQDFPALNVADFPGKAKVNPAKFKGKVVIVDFWASWCEPCKVELPALDKLHKKYKGKLVVIGVNVDENLNDAKAFLKDHPVGFDLVHDKGQKNVRELGIETMPTSFILANGKIVKVHKAFKAGDEKKIDAEIKKLLSEG